MEDLKKYMQMSVDVSAMSNNGNLKVGAVLVTENGSIVYSYNSDKCKSTWRTSLFEKIMETKLSRATLLFVTINTYDEFTGNFDINYILETIEIERVFVGIPDPSVIIYHKSDPLFCIDNNIERYLDVIQKEILEINSLFYNHCPQNIHSSPFYFENRISHLILDELRLYGISISPEDLDTHKSKRDLATYISQRYNKSITEAEETVSNAIRNSFDHKYGSYQYENDTRSLNREWELTFYDIFNELTNTKLSHFTIINVGVGGGREARCLFYNCPKITFVDIAPKGLQQIKKDFPSANIINSSADDLNDVSDNSFDVYISLRTYNSSFFDIPKAIDEAKRVLNNKAYLIISVANGFLQFDHNRIIPGLLIPGTEFVDIYRGMNTVKKIIDLLSQKGFKKIKTKPISTEIFIYANLE